MRSPATTLRRRAPFMALMALVALFSLAACTAPDDGPDPTDPDPASAEDRIISNVWATNDPRVIEVGWFATSCEQFESIEIVEETSSRVSLLLRAFVDPDECTEPRTASTMVTLASDLGDREVYDANTFIRNTVVVEPPR